MTLLELAQLVRMMRTAQRDYFTSRTLTDLDRSKILERRVDRAVREVLAPPGLFPEPGKDGRR